MKRIVSLALAVLMIACCAAFAVNAGTYDAKATLSSATVERGGTATLTVKLDKAVTGKSAGIAFTLPEGITADATSAWTVAAGTLIANYGLGGKTNGACVYATDTAFSGDIFSLKIKVADDCSYGDHEIKVAFQLKTAANDDLAFENVSGVITVPNNCSHNSLSDWQKDDTNHWKVCLNEDCGAKVQTAKHVYDNNCDPDCNVCGYVRVVTHTIDTATWKTNAEKHWHECSVCHNAKEDEAAHNFVEKGENLASEATCKTPAKYFKVCDTCGYVSETETFEKGDIDPTKHVYELISVDEGYKCSECGDTKPVDKGAETKSIDGVELPEDSENTLYENEVFDPYIVPEERFGERDAIDGEGRYICGGADLWIVINDGIANPEMPIPADATVTLPIDLEGYEDVKLFDMETEEEIEFTDNGDGTVSFVVGNTYSVMFTTSTVPQTGDAGMTALWIALAAIAMIGMIAVAYTSKKRVTR